MMKFSNIVLCVLGSEQKNYPGVHARDLKEDINRIIQDVCRHGSEKALEFAIYNSGSGFSLDISRAVSNLQSGPMAAKSLVLPSHLHCIFVINDSMSEAEWINCIDKTRAELGLAGHNLTTITYTAIVQKEGLCLDKLQDVLYDMTTYIFGHHTQKSVLIRSVNEEKQLLSYYTVLAACDKLYRDNSAVGIYTGSFDRLSLRSEDFDRIRRHYILKALWETDHPNKDAILTACFAGWLGIAPDFDIHIVDLGNALRKKLRPLYPKRSELALLANPNSATLKGNIERFLDTNFEIPSEKGGAAFCKNPRYMHFLERFVQTASGRIAKNSPEETVRLWEKEADELFNKRIEYYDKDVCEFISGELCGWIRRKADELEAHCREEIFDPRADIGAGVNKKNFVGPSIDAAEAALKPYIELAGAYLMRAIAVRLDKKARRCAELTCACRAYLARYNLTEVELEDDKIYASEAIEKIEAYCRSGIHADVALRSGLQPYFSEQNGKAADAWEKLLTDLNAEVKENSGIPDLISNLDKATAVEFQKKIGDALPEKGYRLGWSNAAIRSEGADRVLYIYSNRLSTYGSNGKEFEESFGFDAESASIDNIYRFGMAQLTALVPLKQAENEDDDTWRRRRYAHLISCIPTTDRSADTSFETRDDVHTTYTAEEHAPVEPESSAPVLPVIIGNELVVTLPVGLNPSLKCTIEGYDENGLNTEAVHPTVPLVYGVKVKIPIPSGKGYGNCTLKLSGEYASDGAPFIMKQNFEGRHTEEEEYTLKVKKGLFAHNIKLADDDGGTIELMSVQIKLKDSGRGEIGAKINPFDTTGKDDICYPIGSGTEWNLYVPEEFAESMSVRSDDPTGVRILRPKV